MAYDGMNRCTPLDEYFVAFAALLPKVYERVASFWVGEAAVFPWHSIPAFVLK